MKFTVTIVLLVAAAQAAEVRTSARKQKTEDAKTDKRELEEGNAAVAKRAPVLPTALPSVTPGIEYADSKEVHHEKSPSQVYATPVPIGKISDLLTGQGPFQTAIASHLFAPVSVYQARLGAPTTYEVSSPITSQLAYSEHKISYQPQQNAIQYQPAQYNQKLQVQKQANFARPINYQQPYQQQIFVQPQPLMYSQQPQHLVPVPQPIQYQQIPFQVQRPVQYTQHTVFPQQFVQQQYNQEQQNLVRVPAEQPGITYSEESKEDQNQEQATQAQQKAAEQTEEPAKASETQTPAPEKNYNSQPQGAISYASFSQSQPAPSFASQPSRLQAQLYQAQAQSQQYESQPKQYQVQPQQFQAQPQQNQAQQQQYQVQHQAQLQQYQVQPLQYQAQPQQYQAQPQPYQAQPQLYEIQQVFRQPQPQQFLRYDLQPQLQYQTSQNSPSKASQETIVTASTKSLPVNPQRQISYFRPGPVLPQIQPQQYAQQQILLQNPVHAPQQLAAPSFPPVQYFGKYAQSIFGPH